MQLEGGCSPSCNTFPSFCLAFTREPQTFRQSATQTISAKPVMDSRHFVFYHTGQRKNQDGGKQNGESPCYLK